MAAFIKARMIRAGAVETAALAASAVTTAKVADGAITAAKLASGVAMGDLGTPSELTIASGAIATTGKFHTVDTQSDAASDDLDTVTGVANGELVLLRPASAARTVVVKHGTGNIKCPQGVDISLAEATDHVLLIGDGTNVTVLASSVLAGQVGQISVNIAAEVGNARAVTIQLKDAAGNNIARQQLIEIVVRASEALVVISAATTGTLVSGAGSTAVVLTDANGTAVVTLNDGSAAFVGTASLRFEGVMDATGSSFEPCFACVTSTTFA